MPSDIVRGSHQRRGYTSKVSSYPVECKEPSKGKMDARMKAVGWNKETGAQVDFVEPETWVVNHHFAQGMKKPRFILLGNHADHP